jgi:hypothetical protein
MKSFIFVLRHAEQPTSFAIEAPDIGTASDILVEHLKDKGCSRSILADFIKAGEITVHEPQKVTSDLGRAFLQSRPESGPGSMEHAKQQYGESVESIASMITEDIRPGTLGISEEEKTERGDHQQVKYLARYIVQYANKFHQMADMGDLEEARLAMAQVKGAVEQAFEHIDLLSKEKGLPNLSV